MSEMDTAVGALAGALTASAFAAVRQARHESQAQAAIGRWSRALDSERQVSLHLARELGRAINERRETEKDLDVALAMIADLRDEIARLRFVQGRAA